VFEQSVRLLESLEHPFALVGGLAVSSRAEPRFTRDIDLAVLVHDDAEAESVIFTLRQSGYQVISVVEQEATGRLATIRLRVPLEPHGAVLDLLFASCGIEPESRSSHSRPSSRTPARWWMRSWGRVSFGRCL